MLHTNVDLSAVRRDLKVSSYQMAQTLGITRPTLSGWEREPEKIPLVKLRKWADALGLEVEVKLKRKQRG